MIWWHKRWSPYSWRVNPWQWLFESSKDNVMAAKGRLEARRGGQCCYPPCRHLKVSFIRLAPCHSLSAYLCLLLSAVWARYSCSYASFLSVPPHFGSLRRLLTLFERFWKECYQLRWKWGLLLKVDTILICFRWFCQFANTKYYLISKLNSERE